MAKPGRTQKQISEGYKGNLGYYRRLPPWRRARFIVSLLAILGGLVAIFVFQKEQQNETFFNAGKLSAGHAALIDKCSACHGQQMPAERLGATLRDRFHHGIAFGAIDRKCEACHQRRDFHEANVVKNRSCSACHQEHQGPGPMKAVASLQCATCHNNSAAMQASAQKGMQLPPAAFYRHSHSPQQVVFELPRPPQGFTKTFPSFWDGHPEFQLKTANARDPDVLRFNHQRHFAADIPLVNGAKLDCNYCHKPDADGRFMQRVAFAANCQACHSLQFDSKNPELTLPHGNAGAVRAFLRTLPTQYAELAVKKGITRTNEVQSFVAKQMTQLRERIRSGENFERQVFFATNPYNPQRGSGPSIRASFYGCAFCHEVKPAANAAPIVTKPILVDRWMPQARFNHAKHASVKCDDCHRATQSRDTSDILMPAKANCVSCHSPQGKVVAQCVTCHAYHAPPEIAARFDANAQSPLK